MLDIMLGQVKIDQSMFGKVFDFFKILQFSSAELDTFSETKSNIWQHQILYFI